MSDHDRAKYSADQLKELGAKGQAFKNPDGSFSYPIGDVEDLKNAIHAVGRGNADHDALRKYIIGRAKDLDQSDLIPENWNADGSLADESKAATWDAQHRDQTYGDTYDALTSAVSGKFAGSDDDWAWLIDFSDTWAVYSLNGEKFQVPYTYDGTTVTLGAPTPVHTVTNYVPLEAKSARADAAGDCPTCDGTGKIMDGNRKCPDCQGTGNAPEKKSAHRSPIILKRTFGTLLEQTVPVSKIELRADDAADPNIAHFTGYASTTGTPYAVTDWLGEYRETIQPGAFAKTLREQSDVPLLFNHDGFPLASTGSGTSKLAEDAHGLRNDAVLDRSDGNTNTVCVQLRRGVLNKMSFAFRAIKDGWNDSYDERDVSELALYDTSIVTYPANPATSADLRTAMRSALGREGASLMYSVRSALIEARQDRISSAAEPLVENALRALAAADEFMCHRYGNQGRARTFAVAGLLVDIREGKVLSADNNKLAQTALVALHAADDEDIPAIVRSLQTINTALDDGQAALSELLGKANPDGDPKDLQPTLSKPSKNGSDNDGLDGDAGGGGLGGSKNPLSPADGAGPRFASVDATRRLLERLRNS